MIIIKAICLIIWLADLVTTAIPRIISWIWNSILDSLVKGPAAMALMPLSPIGLVLGSVVQAMGINYCLPSTFTPWAIILIVGVPLILRPAGIFCGILINLPTGTK